MQQNDTIISERMRILFERAFFSNLTAIVASVIFAYIMREQFDVLVTLLWLGFMFIVTSVRFWIIFDYKNNFYNIRDDNKYENWFAYITGLVGVGWAAFMALGLSSDYIEYRIYSVLLLVAIISIAVNIFSTSIKTLYFYLLPPLIISIPMLLSRGGNDSAIGIALIVFSLMALRSGKDVSQTISDTLHLRSQTQILLDKLDKLEKLEYEKSSTFQRMQGIMNYAPTAIYVKDLDGHFTFINKKVADLCNMQHGEIIGKTVYDILPKDIADVMHENDLEVINLKMPVKYQESAPLNGETRHYLSIKFPLFNDEGELSAVGGVSTDITERVHMEESLNISQQRLLLQREQSPLGVIEWNTKFEFLDWNPAAEKIFGFTKNEVMGNHITKRILPENAREEVNKVWENLITSKGGTYSLNENITKDGRIITCEWHNTPLTDSDGNVIGVTSLVEDITERKKSEENLRHAQKMDAVGKLTGGIAHDFNNMLGVILGFNELLRGRIDENDSKLVKYSEQIFHAGENAKKLTSKLLQFSSKDTSDSELTDVNKLLDDIQHMLEKTLTARINLALELEENISPVWLDKSVFGDSIINMSINAMHAMPKGGDLTIKTNNVHITDLTNKDLDILPGDYVLISVIDSGLGMSKEVKEKIFDPFFTTKKEGGTGLGMSQVYGFVKQSDGTIEISSETNHGTKIEIYLPKYQGVEENVTEEKIINNEKELATGNEAILVVDDELSLLSLVTEILTKQGYTVYCAENGEQALEILKTHSVELMLSDVIMPGMDGYQLATEVNKKYPNIKIQMASGFTGEADLNITNRLWHDNRLHKPLSAKDLLNRVRTLLDEAG